MKMSSSPTPTEDGGAKQRPKRLTSVFVSPKAAANILIELRDGARCRSRHRSHGTVVSGCRLSIQMSRDGHVKTAYPCSGIPRSTQRHRDLVCNRKPQNGDAIRRDKVGEQWNTRSLGLDFDRDAAHEALGA